MAIEERTLVQKFKDNFAIIVALGLVILGLYTYRIYIRQNFIISLILFGTSTLSMAIIFGIWRKFTVKYAPNIIYWTTQQKILRKAVAGGSFSYYEYKPNIYKIGLFEPVSRFISMMIAFIGIASTLANAFGLEPNPPVEDLNSALVWSLLIIIVPIILTPIVPIIWAMEDLELKSWNEKWKTNVRVSRKYKSRFNSFIAIGTLGVAFSLSSDPNLTRLENAAIFFDLVQVALVALVYPIAVLTLLYYIYFRGIVIDKIRNRMNIPMAETRLVYRNLKGQVLDAEGNVIADKPKDDSDLIVAIARTKPEILVEDEPSESDTVSDAQEEEDDETEKNLPQKIGSSAKNAVTKTTDAVVDTGKAIVGGVANVGKSISDNTVGRLFGKSEDKKEDDGKKTQSGGSATAGLWDSKTKEENKDQNETKPKDKKKKRKGGSATAGLWDDE